MEMTLESFEKETIEANSDSAAYIPENKRELAGKKAAHLQQGAGGQKIFRARNNWVCYDSRERRIMLTHSAVRINCSGPAGLL
jgi:hypothetical protein